MQQGREALSFPLCNLNTTIRFPVFLSCTCEREFRRIDGATKVLSSNLLGYSRHFVYQQLLTLSALNSELRLYLQTTVAIINTLRSVIIRLHISAKNYSHDLA